MVRTHTVYGPHTYRIWSAHIPHMVRTHTVYGPHTYRIWSAHIPYMVRTHTAYAQVNGHYTGDFLVAQQLHNALKAAPGSCLVSPRAMRSAQWDLAPPPHLPQHCHNSHPCGGGGESENGISSMHKCQQRPVYVAKESCLCGKRDLFKWQKRPFNVAKESCLSGKRDLCMWQKRPVYVAKESCKHTQA